MNERNKNTKMSGIASLNFFYFQCFVPQRQRAFNCQNPLRVTSIELSTTLFGAVSREENQTEHAKEAE